MKGAPKKPVVSCPHDAFTFHCYKAVELCMTKHWVVTLEDSPNEPYSSWLMEFTVFDGLHRKNMVQRVEDVFQCSCKSFFEDEADFCEHVAVVKLIEAFPNCYMNGGLISSEIQKRKRVSRGLVYSFRYLSGRTLTVETINHGRRRAAQKDKTIDGVGLVRWNQKHSEATLESNSADQLRNSGTKSERYSSAGILQSGLNLYGYQEDIFHKMIYARKAVCSMKMGSGKTLLTIACYGWILKNIKSNARALIICPKSLKLQWKSEISRALGITAVTIDGQKDLETLGESQIGITTYQFFGRHHEKFIEQEYDLAVMDEIQFIRNDESKAWKAAKKLKTEFFFGLSGTVIENALDDLYCIMDVIAPGSLGPRWKFSDKFQNQVSMSRTVAIFKGIKNSDMLREAIKDRVFGFSNLKLPGITHTFLPVGMSAEQKNSHDYYQSLAKKLLSKSLTQGLSYSEKAILQSYLLKARQSCNSYALISKQTAPVSPKIKEIERLVIECIKKNRKVVMFSQWTEMLDLLAEHFRTLSIGFVFYTGRESEKKRVANIDSFCHNPNVMIFLASDSGGVGIDGLQTAASVVIHVELPWNPARLDQRTGRVHRIGQTRGVNVIYFYARNSIEEGMMQTLQDKRDIRTSALEETAKRG